MKSGKFLFDREIFFMALGDKTRLRLLNLIREGEISVGSLVDILGESQPKVSRHLAYLKSAGIVESRREGKWIYYKIALPADEFAVGILSKILEWLSSNEEMRAEYKLFSERYANFIDFNLEEHSDNNLISGKTDLEQHNKRELEIYLL
jgi:ArsR family transcriptional regulator, arsenate/arsenite/antimonite-responsive transcriptional repressor